MFPPGGSLTMHRLAEAGEQTVDLRVSSVVDYDVGMAVF